MRTDPATLTTLDLLKTWAVILLLIDLTGAFLFPVRLIGPEAVGAPELWWRVMGRLSVPVWFFLIGYARSRDLSPPLWGSALALLAASLVCGLSVFPLDLLWTIILIRWVLDRLARFTFQRTEHLILVLAGCALFAVPLPFLIEFGPIAFLLALTGFAVRHADEAAYPLLLRPWTLSVLYWASFLGMAFTAGAFFGFGRGQLLVATLGPGLVLHLLMRLECRDRPDLAVRLGPVLTRLLQLTGRNTLWIYVSSILFFYTLCWSFHLGLPMYDFLDWEWTVLETFEKMRTTKGLVWPQG